MSRVMLSVFVGLGLIGAMAMSGVADDGHELLESTMKDYFKGKTSIVARATKGEASDAEKAQLATAVKKLADIKPPKGDEAAWKTKIAALVAAADAVAKGAPGAEAALKEAANCKACHSDHKPD